jgi:hypothetical protein
MRPLLSGLRPGKIKLWERSFWRFSSPLKIAKSIMNRRDFDIDHIDPVWRDGRDYQLVCGFKRDPKNLREEDPSINTAKSNRFLPWRWCRDEIGVVPEEPGDLALFLVNGEWVLMEFMSDEWFEATRGTSGQSKGNDKQWETWRNSPELLDERNRKIVETLTKKKREDPSFEEERIRKSTENNLKSRQEKPEMWERVYEGNSGKMKELWSSLPEEERIRRCQHLIDASRRDASTPEGRKKRSEGAKKQAQERYMCLITGYISTAQWVTIRQRKLGIDPSPANRVKVK